MILTQSAAALLYLAASGAITSAVLIIGEDEARRCTMRRFPTVTNELAPRALSMVRLVAFRAVQEPGGKRDPARDGRHHDGGAPRLRRRKVFLLPPILIVLFFLRVGSPGSGLA